MHGKRHHDRKQTGLRQLRNAANNLRVDFPQEDIHNKTSEALYVIANWMEFGGPYRRHAANTLRALAARIDILD